MWWFERTRSGFWFRLAGYGLHVKDLRKDNYLSFSERIGKRRYWLIGPFRILVLRRSELKR